MATMMYAISTTLAMTAAMAPAKVELPILLPSLPSVKCILCDQWTGSRDGGLSTLEDHVQGQVVRANRATDHGHRKTKEFDDDGPAELFSAFFFFFPLEIITIGCNSEPG